jgi:hypothetical protein
MNYGFVLNKYYPDKKWACGLTYDEFYWDEEEEKPTDEHLQSLWVPLELDLYEMRQERNRILYNTDYKVVSDYPGRDKWITYRQQLRDLPADWVKGKEFPEIPT